MNASPAPHGLVRCPFCASVHVTMGQRELPKGLARGLNVPGMKYYVSCDACWARGPAAFDRTQAHAAWNERRYA